MKKIIKIDGMHCDNCALRVKASLEKIDNINKVIVNLDNNEAIIEYNNQVDLDLIKETIDDLGFQVKSIK